MFSLKNFKAYEFVCEAVFNDRGDKSLQLLDLELLVFIDRLRDELGQSITVNNWFWGGGGSVARVKG